MKTGVESAKPGSRLDIKTSHEREEKGPKQKLAHQKRNWVSTKRQETKNARPTKSFMNQANALQGNGLKKNKGG